MFGILVALPWLVCTNGNCLLVISKFGIDLLLKKVLFNSGNFVNSMFKIIICLYFMSLGDHVRGACGLLF